MTAEQHLTESQERRTRVQAHQAAKIDAMTL